MAKLDSLWTNTLVGQKSILRLKREFTLFLVYCSQSTVHFGSKQRLMSCFHLFLYNRQWYDRVRRVCSHHDETQEGRSSLSQTL